MNNGKIKGKDCEVRETAFDTEFPLSADCDVYDAMRAMVAADGASDTAKAKTLYKKYERLAKQGLPQAQCVVGECCINGFGTRKNFKKGFEWFKKSAEQGCARAQYHLGWYYYQGTGTAQDYEQTFVWWKKVAEQGDSDAQGMLGWCYETGNGTKQDYEQAFEWYKKSAEQGYADAQNALERVGKMVVMDVFGNPVCSFAVGFRRVGKRCRRAEDASP